MIRVLLSIKDLVLGITVALGVHEFADVLGGGFANGHKGVLFGFGDTGLDRGSGRFGV